jgi:4'-phosphopantetheinyl transferase
MIRLEQIPGFVTHSVADEAITDRARIHVWFTDLDAEESEPAQLPKLSISEQERATRLKSPLERRRYIASRAFTRRILGNISGTAPESLEFRRDTCGKPMLNVPDDARESPSWRLLDFNVSHSENVLGVVVGLACDVGIDIEVVSPGIDALSIAQANLEQADIDLIRATPVGERVLLFYYLWTRREALAKMQGHGVTSDHVDCRVSLTSSIRSFQFTIVEKVIVGCITSASVEGRSLRALPFD